MDEMVSATPENVTLMAVVQGRAHDPLPSALILVIYLPLFVVGLAGNGMLVYIISQHKKLWTIVNLYILNLSVANLLECLAVAVSPALSPTPPLCVLLQGVQDTCACVAVYTLLALTAERYHSVAYPLHGCDDIGGTGALLVTVWTFAAVFGVGNQLFSGRTRCRPIISQYGHQNPVFEFLIIYFLPLSLILLCYILIGREIYLSADKDTESLEQIRLVKKKISLVILFLVVTYMSSFFPYYSARLLLQFNLIGGADWETYVSILYTLTNLHFCMNPIILYVFSKPCRVQFNIYLAKCVCMTQATTSEEQECGTSELSDQTSPKVEPVLQTSV